MPTMDNILIPEAKGLILLTFMQLNKPGSVIKYKTNPPHVIDKTLRPILHPLMKITASAKVRLA